MNRRSRPTHRRRPSRVQSLRPLAAFLLIASFGILFAGCTTSDSDLDTDEFTFTADDVARFRDLVNKADETMEEDGTPSETQPHLVDEEGTPLGDEVPVLNLSQVSAYDAMRTGPSTTGDNLYRVTNAFLNVRAEPRVTAAQLDRLNRGDVVEVLDFVNAAWAEIPLGEDQNGYVSVRYIAKLVPEHMLAEEKKKFDGTYFVNFGFLNVRKDADTNSDKIGELDGQSLVRPLSMDDTWARVPFEEDEGYVAREYLAPFVPNFLVRQERFTLPVLHYRLTDGGALESIAAHVAALREAGVTIITFGDFQDILLSQEERDVRLDPNTAILAVSGVTAQNIKSLSEALLSASVKATVFVLTKHLGLSGITEKNILTLVANGHDVQSAAHTGDDLRSLTNAQVELELKQSRALLEEQTGRPVFAVSYPRGGVNDRVQKIAADAGYLLGLGASPQKTFDRGQLLRLPSFQISGGMTGDDVVRTVSGE